MARKLSPVLVPVDLSIIVPGPNPQLGIGKGFGALRVRADVEAGFIEVYDLREMVYFNGNYRHRVRFLGVFSGPNALDRAHDLLASCLETA